jgi:galactokinase
MQHLPGVTGGLALRITAMDLPLGKGVASSAAVCILVARAFNSVYQLGLFPHELMDLAYMGERLTGSQCGRMDQACIYGQTPVLVTFERADACRVEPVSAGGRIDLFIVDLAGRKDTVQILGDLQQAYPGRSDLQSALGIENERLVRRAHQALTAGDGPALGALMREAQSLFDRSIAPNSRQELASPMLHEVLDLRALKPHVFGGKGVGSGGDGMAQFVARSPGDRRAAMERIVETYPQMKAMPLTIWPAGAGPGNDDV